MPDSKTDKGTCRGCFASRKEEDLLSHQLRPLERRVSKVVKVIVYLENNYNNIIESKAKNLLLTLVQHLLLIVLLVLLHPYRP